MPRRDDRRIGRETRASRQESSRNRGMSARTGRTTGAPRSSRTPRARQEARSQADRSRTRSHSHGSSRPESSAHQRSYSHKQAGASRPVPLTAVSTRPAHDSAGRQGKRARAGDRAAQKSPSVAREAMGPARSGNRSSYSARRGGSARPRTGEGGEYVETTVGELRRADRMERAKKTSRRYFIRIGIILAVIVALVVGGVVLYNSPVFAIANVKVNGVEHLTSDEMAQLANVPKDTTLLRVDTATIEKRIEQNAWVEDAQVNRAFPDTLEINVTERDVFAVVEVPSSVGASVKQWAIASDHMWLMPIPDATSDAAKSTSSKIYEDAARVLHIVDVPFGTKAEIGQVCADSNINNALDILSGLTTDLAGRIAQVSAAGTAETTLLLDNGVEIAFGKAEDIRDKERVVLQILADNEDNVAYINVRMVETPTWRAI